MKKGKDGFYCKYIKRILDILCALAAMIVFCWLYALIAILVRVKLGRPIVYKQERVGLKEKGFALFKFRSMNNARDMEGNLLPDAERVTKFGAMLRSFSLDELPEAWNILKGEMSVVGPRPLPMSYMPYFTPAERQRHDMRPGLSGLAQVTGRNFMSWTEKFEYDVYYINNCTFLLDASVVWKTAMRCVQHKDVMDIATISKDEDGKPWVMDNGVKRFVNQPLNIERGESYIDGNRQ